MPATLEGADAYHDARGNAAWIEADELARQQALLRGVDYIEARYLARLDPNTPDSVIERAVYIAAGLELGKPGFFSATSHPDDPRKVLTGVGDIKWQVVDTGRGEDGRPVSDAIEVLLETWLRNGNGLGLAVMVV